MDRTSVYEVIDGEREYQDSLWTELDKKNTLGDFIIYMENYLNNAKRALYGTYENFEARDNIRKVTALGVAALEMFGTRSREEEGSKRGGN